MRIASLRIMKKGASETYIDKITCIVEATPNTQGNVDASSLENT